MSALRLLISVALPIGLLSGCNGVTPSDPLTLTSILANTTGITSGVRDRRTIVVTDAQAFADLWAELNQGSAPVPPLPAVDFAKEIVVGFASGGRPTSGYSVRLYDPVRVRGVVEVKVEETTPGADCALLQVITAPIDLARLTRTGEEVRFAVETVVKNCS